jgi:hypothetical protein
MQTNSQLVVDYLIIGSGAVGMAFADSLFRESSCTLLIVDKHYAPGGHWVDAYPFVRLHQPSSYYGVNSRVLGTNSFDTDPLNKGMTERASGVEILAYYETVMRELTESGRVHYWPSSEHQGARQCNNVPAVHRVTSLVSGQIREVVVVKKVVDTTVLNTQVPSTHPPKYDVDSHVRCIALNDLPKITKSPPAYVVVGAGKTGVDACLWLLANHVNPNHIIWVMPRDSWFINRANVQAGDTFFTTTFTAIAKQFEAINSATTLDDLWARLEKDEQLLRIDPSVQPTMYHAAVMSVAERDVLRNIKNIVRLGRVKSVEPDQIVLQRGSVNMPIGSIVVDCSASAVGPSLANGPARPVFDANLITPQFIQSHQPTFSAALIAFVEAHFADEDFKNKLCKPVPMPDTPITWLTMMAAARVNRSAWMKESKVAQWIEQSRLDGFTQMLARVQDDDTNKIEVLNRLMASGGTVGKKIAQLIQSSSEPSGV